MSDAKDQRMNRWFTDLNIGTKASLMLTVVMGLFLISALMFLNGQAQVRDAQRWSDHTYAVLATTAKLENHIADQVAQLRGFELAQEAEFRDGFKRDSALFDTALTELLQLTADNPEQQARLQRIAELKQQWQQVYTDPAMALAADPARHAEMMKFILTRPGRPLRTAIRSEIQAIATVERGLLKARNAKLMATLDTLRLMAIGMFAFGLLASLLSILVVKRHVAQPLSRLRSIIDRQTGGDLDVEVSHLDRGDEIGAMARAIEAFRLAAIEARQREWIKTGISALGRKLSGADNDQAFGRAVLSHLGPLVGAGAGVLHRVEAGGVSAIAAWGVDVSAVQNDADTKPESTRNGLAAQCARGNVAIEVDPIPDDYLTIRSGLGAAPPRNLLLLPLPGASGIAGVLELASFTPPGKIERDMLDEASRLIGLAMEALGNALRTQELLEETRVQSEELQSSEESLRVQAEELRTTNEALADKGRALNEFNERLVGFQAELEQKNQDLENASRYKSEFLANMSHELRTPLNSLLILAKDLADNGNGNLDAEQVESAQIVHDSGTKLLNLINDILDLSKIEAGRMDVNWEASELAPLLTSLDRQFRRTASQRGIGFELNIAEGLPARIVTDAGKLNQILVNLVGNALKFTQHGAVKVSFARPDADMALLPGIGANETLALSVSDTGIGISEEQLVRLFQPFEQADGTTSRRFGGTGLGLSISRALAKMIGGDIVVRSTPDQGSRFTLLIPEKAAPDVVDVATISAAPRARGSSTPARPVSSAAPSGNDDRGLIANGDITILIAEDDSAFARVLADIARRKGYRALIAGDGPTALDLARRYRPQGILLDVGLPLLDGWQVLEQLKADPTLRHIPAHFITATDDASRGLALGAVGFVTKPATREALDAAFNRVLHFADGRRRKLLIIDDEAAARTAVTRLLAGQAVDIIEAETAAAALTLVAEHSFDCIILDLTLPDASGFDVLEQLSRRGTVPPVVIYSARELSRDENAKLREYTDSIVIKGAQSPGRLLDEVTLFLHAMRNPTSSDRSGGDLAGRTVLIVDDDMRNVFALSKALRSHGLQVVVAQDGHKALTQLEQHSGIECVLMDVMMPGMDGYEATRQIRARPQWRDLPIIAVTAKAMKGDREKCLEAGANDYLTKPIDLDKLLSILRAWLHRG